MTVTPDTPAAPRGEPLLAGARAAAGERHLQALAAITAAGGALRFSTLGLQSFWYDEVLTWQLVRLPFWSMAHAIPRTEANPPLYYVLAWAWTRALGFDEAGLRSLSALFGTLAIPVLYWGGTRLVSRRVGLVAAAFGAFSPYLVWYSQEARSYALFVLLAALSVPLLVEARRARSRRAALAWSLVAVAALATHYFAVFVVLAELPFLLWPAPRRLALPALVPLACGGLMLLPLALRQRDEAPVTWIAQLPLRTRVKELIWMFFTGEEPGAGPAHVLVPVSLGGMALAAVFLVWFGTARDHRAAALTAGVGAAVLAIPLMGAVAGSDYFFHRNLIGAWPLLALAVAVGLAGRGVPRVGLVVAAGLSALFLIGTVVIDTDTGLQRGDYRHLAALLRPGEDRRVLISSDHLVPLLPYLPTLRRLPNAGVPVRNIDLVLPGGDYVPRRVLGFALISQQRRGRFLVMRYRAPHPERVTREAVLAQMRSYRPQFALELARGTPPPASRGVWVSQA